jgi:hypothetical protein
MLYGSRLWKIRFNPHSIESGTKHKSKTLPQGIVNRSPIKAFTLLPPMLDIDKIIVCQTTPIKYFPINK